MSKKRVIIMGAAGRDFHNFNVYYRENNLVEVVAFTATQIPHIAGRLYPPELAGKYYPKGIPIYPESELISLIQKEKIDEVVFAYSDVSHEYIMHWASQVVAAGASFILLGSNVTLLQSKIPVIAICAVRTGCGKSQTTRRVSEILRKKERRVVVIRHPMPYGDLVAERIQRFATLEDLQKNHCTIEEMEEYEPHLRLGNVVYAGVDYGEILRQAEKEADVILWDGGNNDTPFIKPTLLITVLDPHRAGHEMAYYPGEVNFRTAHVLVINKMDSAPSENVKKIKENIARVNPKATVIEAASPIGIDFPERISGKRVLVIEDGPTLTHGEMPYGAGFLAAQKYHASEIVDPRPWAKGSIAETFQKYPHIGPILPAMGYGKTQIQELEETINTAECDTVILGTPVDLTRILHLKKPVVKVHYGLQELGSPTLEEVLKAF